MKKSRRMAGSVGVLAAVAVAASGLIVTSVGSAAPSQAIRVAVVTRHRRPQRQGLQLPVERRPQPREEGLQGGWPRVHHEDGRRPPAEPHGCGAAGLQPRDRRRLPDVRSAGEGAADVPEHEVRGHRRSVRLRHVHGEEGQHPEPPRAAVQGSGSGLPRRQHRRARGGASGQHEHHLRARRQQGSGHPGVPRRLQALRASWRTRR